MFGSLYKWLQYQLEFFFKETYNYIDENILILITTYSAKA
jgi:hypothetical protein